MSWHGSRVSATEEGGEGEVAVEGVVTPDWQRRIDAGSPIAAKIGASRGGP